MKNKMFAVAIAAVVMVATLGIGIIGAIGTTTQAQISGCQHQQLRGPNDNSNSTPASPFVQSNGKCIN